VGRSLIRRTCLTYQTCLTCLVKQLPARADGALGLPERGPAVVAERVERADVGERHHFVATQPGARDELVE